MTLLVTWRGSYVDDDDVEEAVGESNDGSWLNDDHTRTLAFEFDNKAEATAAAAADRARRVDLPNIETEIQTEEDQ